MSEQSQNAEPSGLSQRFDVFLSHHGKDKQTIERIAEKLKQVGLEPWLDKWNLTLGGDWQEELVAGLCASLACAVFVGPHGIGRWEDLEYKLATDRMARDRVFRVFLVLLPGLPEPFDVSTLPPFLSLRNWVDLRKGIDDTRAFQSLINAIKGLPLGPEHNIELRNDICPYRGLRTFDEDDAEFFFGRDGDIQRLTEKLKATRFLTIIGSSGSGKSSLVRAGLIPAVRRGALPESNTWTIRIFTPSTDPLTSLAANLLHICPKGAMNQTLDQLNADERSLHLAVSLALVGHPVTERVMLVVDQFEEVFTLCRDEVERAAFLANLLYAAFIPGGRCMVLLTLRADFYPNCAVYPELSARLAEQQFLVCPLDINGLRQVIEEPAWRVGLEFESGVVDTILNDVVKQPGSLPLLEQALLETWERRRGYLLTLEAYREGGGVEGAIAQRADATYASLDPIRQAIVRHVMLFLTQPGEGTEDTRRRVTMKELVSHAGEGGLVESVVQSLVSARLLTMNESEQGGDRLVEVSHEALIRDWPRLQKWIEENRRRLHTHRRLTAAAYEWLSKRKDEDALYSGMRLTQAQELKAVGDIALSELEQEFLEASLAQYSNKLSERLIVDDYNPEFKRWMFVSRVLLGGFLLLTFLGLNFILNGGYERLEQQLIVLNQMYRFVPYSQSILIGHKGVVTHAAFSPDGQFIVTASSDHSVKVWNVSGGPSLVRLPKYDFYSEPARSNSSRDGKFESGHSSTVTSANFSPDGRFLVTASWDNTARVWDGRSFVELNWHKHWVTDANFNPNSRLIVTASKDCTARIWEASGWLNTLTLYGHTEALTSAAFSPDGKLIVTGSDDKTARVWEASSGRSLFELRGHSQAVKSAAFNPDGKLIVTGSDDGTARVWEASSGRSLFELRGHSQAVKSAAFSPDGKLIVTGSDDKTARVWEASSGRSLVELRGHLNGLTNVAFSPDGKLIVTASTDGTARVWNLRNPPSLIELRGHSNSVVSTAFSPNGRLIVTGSDDGTARVWEASSGRSLAELHGHMVASDLSAVFSPDSKLIVTGGMPARVWEVSSERSLFELHGQRYVKSVAFSPDGKWIVTGDYDGTARVWEVSSGRSLVELLGHSRAVWSVAFSPDSKWIVTGDYDGTARVWEASSGRSLFELRGRSSLRSVAFSPDGKWIVTGGYGGTAQVWEASSGRSLVELLGHSRAVRCAAFSPDSKWIVTGSDDGTARVWEASSGRSLAELRGHGWVVRSVAFSPDSKLIVTGSDDKTARVWQASSGHSLFELRGHSLAVRSVAFSPDGKLIVTGSDDRAARIWEVSAEASLVSPLRNTDR